MTALRFASLIVGLAAYTGVGYLIHLCSTPPNQLQWGLWVSAAIAALLFVGGVLVVFSSFGIGVRRGAATVPQRLIRVVIGTAAILLGLAIAVLGGLVAAQNCHVPFAGWGWSGFDLHRMRLSAWATVAGCVSMGLLLAWVGIVSASGRYFSGAIK